MAQLTVQMGAWEDDSIQASITYNNANGSVASATVSNSGPKTIIFGLWRTDDATNPITRTVVPGPAQTFAVMSNVRYSEVELPFGDPKASNFGFSAVTF